MGRGKHGIDVFRGQVQAFRDLGLNNSEIARRLGYQCYYLFNDTGSLSNKKRKSHERKTTPREVAAIARIAKLNPFVGAPKIKEQIAQNLKLDLSVSTVKSRLRENKLFGRVARKKRLVSKRNLVSCFKFAKQHVHKDLSFWQNVLWTDESKFNHFGSDVQWKIVEQQHIINVFYKCRYFHYISILFNSLIVNHYYNAGISHNFM